MADYPNPLQSAALSVQNSIYHTKLMPRNVLLLLKMETRGKCPMEIDFAEERIYDLTAMYVIRHYVNIVPQRLFP